MTLKLNWRESQFQSDTWHADFETCHLTIYKLPVLRSAESSDIHGYFAFFEDGYSEESHQWVRKEPQFVPYYGTLLAAQEALENYLGQHLYRLADYYAGAWRNYNGLAT